MLFDIHLYDIIGSVGFVHMLKFPPTANLHYFLWNKICFDLLKRARFTDEALEHKPFVSENFREGAHTTCDTTWAEIQQQRNRHTPTYNTNASRLLSLYCRDFTLAGF
jgi:hypothetical protein